MNILVVGLGKLGLPLAVFLKSKGHNVSGYDVDSQRSHILMLEGHWEPGCSAEELRGIQWSTLAAGVHMTDMAFICVQTPTAPGGTMDTSFVEQAANEVAYHTSGRPYTIVIASTVMPGTCARIQADMPENVRIVSMPVWIAMGSVLKDLENPPGMVIGCDCGVRGCIHAQTILDVWEHGHFSELTGDQVHLTDTRTAEFIKLAHNAWCCTKMSWLGNIGDRATDLGIDVKALSAFMQRGGERPGQFWQYGPAFGGPCFPRDLRFWLQAMGGDAWRFAEQADPIGAEVDDLNNERFLRLAVSVNEFSEICIVGEGYKKGVPVDEASVSLEVKHLLESQGKVVSFYPYGQETAEVFLRMHNDDTTALPMPQDARPIINAWRQQ